MPKINVYECPGTNVNATVSGQMQYITPAEIALGDFYKGLDPNVFNYNFIQGYANSLKPLQPSVDSGVAIVTQKITENSGKFALIGTSQGALIQSLVYKKLKNGQIPGRLADCVGVFLYGNPAREAGKAFPGASTIPSGHGIATTAFRLTGTVSDSLVWEFANPGDPVCTNGDDLVSQIREGAFTSLLTGFDGTLDSISDVLQIATDLAGWFSFGATAAIGMVRFHNDYNSYKPIAGDNRTATQIAVDYLNTIAGPYYRDDGWSTTLRAPTA